MYQSTKIRASEYLMRAKEAAHNIMQQTEVLWFIKYIAMLLHYESEMLPQKSSYFPFQICSGCLNYLCADGLSESTPQVN